MSNIIYVSGIPVTVEYRRVKNINLYIMPPDGQVLVTAPKRIPMDTICGFVEKKSGWIEKNRVRIQEASRQKETEVQRVLSPKQRKAPGMYTKHRLPFFCIKPDLFLQTPLLLW